MIVFFWQLDVVFGNYRRAIQFIVLRLSTRFPISGVVVKTTSSKSSPSSVSGLSPWLNKFVGGCPFSKCSELIEFLAD